MAAPWGTLTGTILGRSGGAGRAVLRPLLHPPRPHLVVTAHQRTAPPPPLPLLAVSPSKACAFLVQVQPGAADVVRFVLCRLRTDLAPRPRRKDMAQRETFLLSRTAVLVRCDCDPMADPTCFDYVAVYDGSNANAPLLIRSGLLFVRNFPPSSLITLSSFLRLHSSFLPFILSSAAAAAGSVVAAGGGLPRPPADSAHHTRTGQRTT